MDIRYRSKDGLELYAKSYGAENAPLTALCMHGLTRNHKDFEPMIDALLAEGLNVRFIAVDVRGRCNSESDQNVENYTPAVYADDMFTLLDHLGVEKAALIGTSMGGIMSMFMMSMAPERILGVVLNDIGPELEQAGLDRISGYVGGNEPKENYEAAARAVADVQRAAFPNYTFDDWLAFAKRTYRERPDGKVELDYDPAIARTIGEVKPTPEIKQAMWALYAQLSAVPLLLVRGEISDLLSAENAERMITEHGNGELVTVSQIGHTPLLNEPDVVAALTKHLKSLEPNV